MMTTKAVDNYDALFGDESSSHVSHDHVTLTIATGAGDKGRVRNRAMQWGELRARLSTPTVDSAHGMSDYLVLSKDEQGALKAASGFYVGGPCKDGRRSTETVTERSLLCFDLDEVTSADFAAFQRGETGIGGFEWFAHTTRKHTAENPRLRIVMPLSQPVTPEQFGPLARIVASQIFVNSAASMDAVDDASFSIAQMMYWPSQCRDADFYTLHNEGTLIDGEAVLTAFGDWRDWSQLPYSEKRGRKRLIAPGTKAVDPTEKSGPVGVFCRAYGGVVPAIETHLSGRYKPSKRRHAKPRYTFADGSTSDGAVVEDGGRFLYSHHSQDPASGRLCNAFDLVRLHLFGDRDKDIDVAATEMGDLPSFKAMLEFCDADERYRAQLATEDTEGFEEVEEFETSGDAITSGEPAEQRLRFLSPDECAEAPRRGYVIKGLIAPGDVGCIFGAPGAGKSLISPHLGYAVAQGRPAFGMRTKPGRVFYVAAEDPTGMRGRVTALRIRHSEADGFTLVEGVSDLLVKESSDLSALAGAVEEQRPALIFIDTLAMAFPGLEENSAEAMGQVVATARKLASGGAAVILIHHDTKAQGPTPRGHSLLNGALDMALHVFPRDETGVVRGKLTKNRNGSCDRDIAFLIGTESIGIDEDGDEITAAVVSELAGSVAGKRPKLTGPERAALKILEALSATGSVIEDDWRAACIEGRTVSASDDRDSRRKATKRAFEGLARKGAVTISGGLAFVPSLYPGNAFDDEPE